MQTLTQTGQNIISEIAQRYQLSEESAIQMLVAVNRGGGSMAQFQCPELGSGQWMRGGMTMVSDMFNHGLKATVDNLCNELSTALANHQMFPAPENGSGGGNWWPGDLGQPSSSGGQNNTRYAYFPQTRRLAVEHEGKVSVYDTQDHQIGGVSQQQGSNQSLTFSSQYGTISTLSLPLISGEGTAEAPPTNFAEPPAAPVDEPVSDSPDETQTPSESVAPNSHEIIDLLEKMGKLRDAGVLSEDEFSTKKAELLERL